jgi:hypothetical protein
VHQFIEKVRQNPETGLRVVRGVARAHRDDRGMINYGFFQYRATLAIYVIDALGNREGLSEEDREHAEYVNKHIRPHLVR